MARLDNPAGRLHALLKEYRAVANPARTIRQTWATVLGVDPSDVAVALTEVGSLVPAIQAAVSRSGDEDQLELLDTYLWHWASPITTPDHQTGVNPSPGAALVDGGALAALGSLSTYLSLSRSEGAIPDDERQQELKAHVSGAIDELTGAIELPSEVRKLILDRLHDILWAMDRLRIGGPDAVRAAAERLAMSVAASPEEARRSPLVQKAVTVSGWVCAAFMSGPSLQGSIEAWPAIFKALGSGLG